MRTVRAYVERDVAMAFDRGTAAWAFDLDPWGRCGQGSDETAALAALRSQIGGDAAMVVAERVTGDEQAFHRDQRPCTDDERRRTLEILDEVRPHTLALVRSSPDAILDWDDPERVLPSYARWRTVRQMAWHIADVESRYYLPAAGLDSRPRADALLTELAISQVHVRRVVAAMPADLWRGDGHEVWTAVKVLRRLAWHEPGELAVMRDLAARARAATAR